MDCTAPAFFAKRSPPTGSRRDEGNGQANCVVLAAILLRAVPAAALGLSPGLERLRRLSGRRALPLEYQTPQRSSVQEQAGIRRSVLSSRRLPERVRRLWELGYCLQHRHEGLASPPPERAAQRARGLLPRGWLNAHLENIFARSQNNLRRHNRAAFARGDDPARLT